jgi:anti-sigma factor RsiW
MNLLKHWYCRRRMVAFIHGELPPKSRQRIARHFDECPACYAEYINQRTLHYELTSRLPILGQPRPDQLARIWKSVQAEVRPSPRRARPIYPIRYSLVTLGLMLILIFPLILGDGRAASVRVTQPTPSRPPATKGAPGPVAIATQTVELTGEISILPVAAPKRTPHSGE